MKKMRKILSIILALTMIFTLTIASWAEEESEETTSTTTYKITITNDKTGHTYEAYQIFSGDLYEEGDNVILSNIVWGSGVDTEKILSALQESEIVVDEDDDGNDVTLGSKFADCKTAAEVAEVLAGYSDDSAVAQAFAQVASEHLSETATATSTQSEDANEDGTYTYTISGLSAGYYLVKDQDGSVTTKGDAYTDIILLVVDDVDVNTKVVYPDIDKEVSDDGETWGDYTDENIGDTVYYKLTATVPDTSAYNTYEFIFHDTLSDGLTFDSETAELTVTVYDDDGEKVSEIPATYGSGENEVTNWTLKVSTEDNELTDGCTFEVEFTDILSLVDESGNAVTVDKDYTIVVTYEATLNEDAVIGNDGNTNSVYLEYSNNPNASGTGKTVTVTVVTFTFELDVTKVDADSYDEDSSSYETMLSDAQFVLYYEVTETDDDGNETTTTWYLTADEATDDDGNGTGSYTVTGWTDDEDNATTLVSATDGTFEIIGLDTGTYYLEETKAPNGYNLLASPITLKISATYEDTDSDGIEEVKTLTATADTEDLSADVDTGIISATVENNSGSELPSTGGIGTTIFYVVGGILIVGAVVLLITRKRMNNNDGK